MKKSTTNTMKLVTLFSKSMNEKLGELLPLLDKPKLLLFIFKITGKARIRIRLIIWK
jgi:hypothetical protein